MAAMSPGLKRLLRWLRRTHPLSLPVRVFFSPTLHPGDNGMLEGCPIGAKKWKDAVSFRIRLRPGLPQIELREVLLHEWAHGLTALDQDTANSQLDHDSIFTSTYTQLLEEYDLAFPQLPLRRHRL